MKKRIRFAILSIIIVFLVFLYAHISKCTPIYNVDVDSGSYNSVSIYDFNEVSQRFISKENHLNAISIKSRVVGDARGITVKYVLRDMEDGKIAASGELNGGEIKDSKYAKLAFEEVSGCKGKEYEVILRTTGQSSDNIVDFYYETNTDNNSFYRDGRQTEGTLVLKAVTDRFDWETFCVLLIFVIYICGFMKFLYKLFE